MDPAEIAKVNSSRQIKTSLFPTGSDVITPPPQECKGHSSIAAVVSCQCEITFAVQSFGHLSQWAHSKYIASCHSNGMGILSSIRHTNTTLRQHFGSPRRYCTSELLPGTLLPLLITVLTDHKYYMMKVTPLLSTGPRSGIGIPRAKLHTSLTLALYGLEWPDWYSYSITPSYPQEKQPLISIEVGEWIDPTSRLGYRQQNPLSLAHRQPLYYLRYGSWNRCKTDARNSTK